VKGGEVDKRGKKTTLGGGEIRSLEEGAPKGDPQGDKNKAFCWRQKGRLTKVSAGGGPTVRRTGGGGEAGCKIDRKGEKRKTLMEEKVACKKGIVKKKQRRGKSKWGKLNH